MTATYFSNTKCARKIWDELNLEQIRQSPVNAQTAREVVEIILKLKKKCNVR
jgi:hypothetical protein